MYISEEVRKTPKNNCIITFFSIYFMKFHRFVAVNIIFFVVSLPILFYIYLVANTLVMSVLGDESTEIIVDIGVFTYLLQFIPHQLFTPLIITSAIMYGPFKMGVTYVLKNFSLRRHSWFSDVFEKAWQNALQGLFFGLIDIIVLFLVISTISANTSHSLISMPYFGVIQTLSLLFLAFYMIMRRYFYYIAVSIELGIISIIKDAWLLSIAGLGRNFLASLISFLIWMLTLFFSPAVTAVALVLITFSFSQFAAVFICYPLVNRFIIIPAKNACSDND